jgi:hypothetical protein
LDLADDERNLAIYIRDYGARGVGWANKKEFTAACLGGVRDLAYDRRDSLLKNLLAASLGNTVNGRKLYHVKDDILAALKAEEEVAERTRRQPVAVPSGGVGGCVVF